MTYSTDTELGEQLDEILTAVFLNGIVAGDEDKSGELLLSVPEARVRLLSLIRSECARARIDELRQITAITGKYASKIECFNYIEPHTRKRIAELSTSLNKEES